MKLEIELVPKSCWFSNVRSAVTKKQWNLMKSEIASKAWNLCEICGGVGPKHPVECHEVWNYDDNNLIQKLIKMIALCPDCHMVKHMGFAQITNKADYALNHFMKINKINKVDAQKYIKQAFAIWEKRSLKKWKLDITLLKDFGIDIKKL